MSAYVISMTDPQITNWTLINQNEIMINQITYTWTYLSKFQINTLHQIVHHFLSAPWTTRKACRETCENTDYISSYKLN